MIVFILFFLIPWLIYWITFSFLFFLSLFLFIFDFSHSFFSIFSFLSSSFFFFFPLFSSLFCLSFFLSALFLSFSFAFLFFSFESISWSITYWLSDPDRLLHGFIRCRCCYHAVSVMSTVSLAITISAPVTSTHGVNSTSALTMLAMPRGRPRRRFAQETSTPDGTGVGVKGTPGAVRGTPMAPVTLWCRRTCTIRYAGRPPTSGSTLRWILVLLHRPHQQPGPVAPEVGLKTRIICRSRGARTSEQHDNDMPPLPRSVCRPSPPNWMQWTGSDSVITSVHVSVCVPHSDLACSGAVMMS